MTFKKNTMYQTKEMIVEVIQFDRTFGVENGKFCEVPNETGFNIQYNREKGGCELFYGDDKYNIIAGDYIVKTPDEKVHILPLYLFELFFIKRDL